VFSFFDFRSSFSRFSDFIEASQKKRFHMRLGGSLFGGLGSIAAVRGSTPRADQNEKNATGARFQRDKTCQNPVSPFSNRKE